jgi:hypothetical protein
MTTDELIRDLQADHSALARFVERVTWSGKPFAVVSANAVTRWAHTEPANWERVQQWLKERGLVLRQV